MKRETPFYTVDLDVVQESYNAMSSAFSSGTVYYCVKACGEVRVLQELVAIRALFEVSSSAELERVVDAGGIPERTICGLPVKSNKEVERLWHAGVRQFVFDHPDELYRLNQISSDIRAILRLRSDSSEADDPFGVSLDELTSIMTECEFCRDSIRGVTVDLRQNYSLTNTCSALSMCKDAIRLLVLDEYEETPIVNIGGNYRLPNEVGDEFYHGVSRAIQELWPQRKPVLQMEVGRSVVKYAGKLITTVILVRWRDGRCHVFVDAGEPAGVSHGPSSIYSDRVGGFISGRIHARFFGMTCGKRPLFDIELEFVPVIGDVLVLEGMGSYTICKQSDFHGWPRTAVHYAE
jgi:diaminopimelate decarboxylase